MLHFFMLRFSMFHCFHVALFQVALFPCCTFSMLSFFHVSLFQCCTFSMLHFFMLLLFHVTLFLRCTFSMSHFSHVAIFYVAPFSCCIHVALFSLSMFNTSHVALVYYWKILKINARQKTQPKNDLTLSIVNLIHFYFDILAITRFLSLYSFEWLIKCKGTNLLLLFCWNRICLPRLETFKTRMWIEIYFSPI